MLSSSSKSTSTSSRRTCKSKEAIGSVAFYFLMSLLFSTIFCIGDKLIKKDKVS